MANPFSKFLREYALTYKMEKFNIDTRKAESHAVKEEKKEIAAREAESKRLQREYDFEVGQEKKKQEKKKSEAKHFSPWDF